VTDSSASWKDLFRKHPVVTFFILAFALSWLVWAVSLLVPVKNTTYLMLIGVIGAFGPAIGAIIVSGMLNPEPTGIPSLRRWGTFLLLFCLILPFALFWPFLAGTLSDPVFVALCMILTALSAFTISCVLSRYAGVRTLMGSLAVFRVSPVWFAFALFAWPLLMIATGLLDCILSGQPLSSYTAGLLVIQPLSLLVLFLTIFLLGGPLQEEPGWRAFALPRLQFLYNPIVASIILGFLWQLWHVPLYFTGFYPFDTTAIAMRFVAFVPAVIVFTWLFNRAGGSLLIAVLYHASLDTSPQVLPAQTPQASLLFDLAMLVLAIIVIIMDRMWRKQQPDAEHQSPKNESG
jgi:membrane protease YdiL (CAAX protease family)